MTKPIDDDERREHKRYPASIQVDIKREEHFLFAYIENISEMGLFIRSDDPLPIGSAVDLGFKHGDVTLALSGEVVWVNPVRPAGDNINPGMGVRFSELQPEQREQLVQLIRTIAYLATDAATAD